jgi:excisionase family DNA binding protein
LTSTNNIATREAVKKHMKHQEFTNTKELAELLRVSTRTISNWKSDGIIPHIKIRRSVRYHVPSVLEALKQQNGESIINN